MLFFALAGLVKAQSNSVEQKLTAVRVPNFSEISYNAILIIPQLYRENKEDTINQVISYINKNFGSAAFLEPYIILDQIKKRAFREEIRNFASGPQWALSSAYTDSQFYEANIITYYLDWYKTNFGIRANNRYSLYIRNAYGDYIDFIAENAKLLLHTPGLSPVEKWLLNYLLHPDARMLQELAGTEYNGSQLQKAWIKHDKDESLIYGGGITALSGVWVPTGNISVLGTNPFFGFGVTGKNKHKMIFGMDLDVRFLKSPNDYTVKAGSVVFKTHQFFGAYAGFNAGYELLRRKKHEFDLVGGIAGEVVDAVSDDDKKRYNFSNKAGELSTVSLNAGLSYRRYGKRIHSDNRQANNFICIELKYHFLFYNNPMGTNLDGGAVTLGVSVGSINRKAWQNYRKL